MHGLVSQTSRWTATHVEPVMGHYHEDLTNTMSMSKGSFADADIVTCTGTGATPSAAVRQL